MPPADGASFSSGLLRFGVFELDLENREVRRQGRKLRLQNQPFEVLALLVERAAKLVTREELRQRLWPHGTFVDFEQGLNAAVRKLRAALDDDAQTPRFIETVAGHGYRFIAPVERIETTHKPKSASYIAPARTTVILPGREPWRRKLRLGAMIGGTVVVTLILGFGLGGWTMRLRERAEPASRIESLTVLPLADLSRSPAGGALASRLTDELSAALRSHRGLRVIPSPDPAAELHDLPSVARNLGVDAMVEGSVALVGEQVVVSVRLVEAASDRSLWARRYDGRVDELPALGVQIGHDLRSQLRPPL